MLKVEFHCHTRASPDSLVKPRDLVETCRRHGIDRVVITDHNSITGAMEAKALDPQRVILGEEIVTTKGELLAAFVKEKVPGGLTPLEAIGRLRDQGAFISVSHPFDRLRSGAWESDDLLEIVPFVDAIEIFNSRCLRPSFNRMAEDFAREHDLLGTAGSDAHTLAELGRGAMILANFDDAQSLRQAMEEVRYERRRSGIAARIASRYAFFRKGISPGDTGP